MFESGEIDKVIAQHLGGEKTAAETGAAPAAPATPAPRRPAVRDA